MANETKLVERRRVAIVTERPRHSLVEGRARSGVEECGGCAFWARRTDETRKMGGGYCLRFPPIFKEEDALNDGWPSTHQQSWCGEFKAGRHRWNPVKP